MIVGKRYFITKIKKYAGAFFLFVLTPSLAGCVTATSGSFVMSNQEKGNEVCSALFSASQMDSIRTKMVITPGDIPLRTMMSNNDTPTKGEAQSIKYLEATIRQCNTLREAAGNPTSASEDILETRISKVRYALYNREIPYAVYNYGVAKALRSHTEFISEAETAYSKGKEIGRKTAYESMLKSSLNKKSSWDCTARDAYSVGYETRVKVDCR